MAMRRQNGSCFCQKNHYCNSVLIRNIFQKIAERYKCQQCLWLYGPEHTITEVGAMNIFILMDKGNGQKELVTPPLDGGIILPGVTRYVLFPGLDDP